MKYLILFAFSFTTIVCYAQQDSIVPFDKAYKRKYTTMKVTGQKPVIDGKLDDDFWQQNGEWSEPFVQLEPVERLLSPSYTKMKVLYDDKYLYVGIYCKDVEPDKMNRFIGNRDNSDVGDLIYLPIDSYHDYRVAYEFNTNLGGNRTDLIVTDQKDINRSWNAVWESKTHIDMKDSCWTVEYRIPFSQLRYNQHSEDGIWGLHIRRLFSRNKEAQKWSLIPVKNNGHVFSFGELHGMTDLPKPKGIEIVPYVMGKYNRTPRINGSPYQTGDDWGFNAGLDAKFVLSDYVLDMTINPDFGQVELDPSVMNLSAFETFYDEKRPFFLEGKHIFDFKNDNDMMFYSRRIGASPSYHPEGIDNVNSFSDTQENVPIIGALKLTGTNRHGVTLGVLQSITARASSKVTRNGNEAKEVVEPLTNYTVARVQKNWKGNTLLGGMITSVNRSLEESHLKELLVKNAFSGGIDFTQYFMDRLYYIEAKGMFSTVNGDKKAIERLQRSPVHYYQRASAGNYLEVDPNRTSLTGTGGFAKIGRRGNAKWTFAESFSWSSPGFDLNNIGYQKEADWLQNETEISFKQTDSWKMFRTNTFIVKQENKWNYGGVPYSNDISLNWRALTQKRYEMNLNASYGWNWVDTRILRGGPDVHFNPYYDISAKINTDKGKPIMFSLKYEGDHNTDNINHYNSFTPGVTWRIGNHVLLTGEFNYTWNRDNSQYVTTLQAANDTKYIVGYMDQKTYGITMKLNVNITPDMSIQWYGSPFTSIGDFSEFKEARDTKSKHLADRFYTYQPEEITFENNRYVVNRDGGFSFSNPDFTFNEFRSNLVARWEYRPGSTLYLVWEHSMSNRENVYSSGWGHNLDYMFGLPATNVFMVKLNYWFNL